MVLHAGAKLKDRYEICKVVGQGGMGHVYLALDAALGGKKVAVKEMTVNIHRADERAQALRQFREEAHLLASLEHPRLVTVTDFFEDGDNAYLVMAYVDGRTLDELTALRRPGVGEVLEWLDQICEVLEYLHEREPPVLFRDLKPGNVMLDRLHGIRLIDFGIARILAPGQSTSTFLKGAGTAEFAPVEQFGGRGTDHRSDIYSLGATAFALLTGQTPPVSVSVISGDAEPASLSASNPSFSPELDAVVSKAMALRKEDRFQRVADFRAALREAGAVERQLPFWDGIRGAGAPTVLPERVTTLRIPGTGVRSSSARTPLGASVAGSRSSGGGPSASHPAGTGAGTGAGRGAGAGAGTVAGAAVASPSRAAFVDATHPTVRRRDGERLDGLPATMPAGAGAVAGVDLPDRGRRLWVAVTAVMVLAALVGGWAFFVRGRAVGLRVETTPPGAAVWLDGGAMAGHSPLTLRKLAAGAHRLHVEAGGRVPVTISFEVVGSRVQVRPGYDGHFNRGRPSHLVLKLRPRQGFLVLGVTPLGADVYVDDRLVARRTMEQLTLPLRVGTHRVRVTASGFFPQVRTVQIHWRDRLVVPITLRPANGS